ncbi:hypothetical protein ACLB1G_26565 [Oxalobacteraceae bacterium A2-2]
MEERLKVVEQQIAVLQATVATKTDLHAFQVANTENLRQVEERLFRLIHEQTWRYLISTVTIGTLLTGIVYYIARNVH